MSDKNIHFYTRVICLDVLKKQTNPHPQTVEILARALCQDSNYARYFFDDLDNPAWLVPLKEQGIFKNAPEPKPTEDGYFKIPFWEASEYLLRITSRCPEEVSDDVIDIALDLETENIRVLQNLVQAALCMPVEKSVRMIPKIVKWLDNRFIFQLPEYTAQLMVRLAKGEKRDEALKLLKVLTIPTRMSVPEELKKEAEKNKYYRPAVIPKYQTYEFEEIFREHIPILAQKYPFETLEILEGQLKKSIELEERDFKNDLSAFWRPAIEGHQQNSNDFKDVLVTSIRRLLEGEAKKEGEKLELVIRDFLNRKGSIFRRLAIHIIRLHLERFHDFLCKLFNERENLDDTTIHHEFFLLMKDGFKQLPEKLQDQFLKWIEEGPDLEGYAKAPDIDQERLKRIWTYKRLWILRDHLPEKYRQWLEELKIEFGDEPEYPDFLSYTTLHTGPTSPKTKKELAEVSPSNLIEHLKSFKPSQDPTAPSPEGLARLLNDIIKENPSPYAQIALQFIEEDILPTYIFHLLWGLEQAWKEGKDFDWEPVIALCEDVIDKQDKSEEQDTKTYFEIGRFRDVKMAVAGLLREGLRNDAYAIPAKYMRQVRNIILQLIYDPNPTPEHEKKYGGDNMDFVTLAINTVRGRAMETLIEYALRYARLYDKQAEGTGEMLSPDQRLEPEIKAALTEKLDKSRDPSPAVHSIFGMYLPNLDYLDETWVRKHLNDIFPAEPEKDIYWYAAWDAYVFFTKFYNNIYRLLRPQYQKAVGLVGKRAKKQSDFREFEVGLGKHLMVVYWSGLEELEEENSLVALFFQRASDEARSRAIWFLGKGLRENRPEKDSKKWLRLKELWKNRVETASRCKDTIFRMEMTSFADWLKYVPERLDDLYYPIQKTIPHLEGYWHGTLLKYLAKEARTYPKLAINLLLDLVEQKAPNVGYDQEVEIILACVKSSNDKQAHENAKAVIDILLKKYGKDFTELLP